MAWIFGYGSLMWDPFFPYLSREKAELPGYHRAFVMSFARVWGRSNAPCAVLGLERGGRCEGVAYEVEPERLLGIEEELRAFEGDAFEVSRRTILVLGREVEASVALNKPSHPDYLGRLPSADRVAMVLRAQGAQASCLDYVTMTAESLQQLGIKDQGVLEFLRQVKEARGQESEP
ncbi:MAG: gamma-glutamylcyclotransferase [Thermoplasmata archaeon]